MRPIGLYIHIPFCVRKCNYCDFASVAGRMALLPAYLHVLREELCLQAAQWPQRRVETVFLGGGTPSLLPPEAYGPLLEAVRTAFPLADDAEISLEANPGTITQEKAHAMREAGFNRVSLGVQAAQDDLLRHMGRIHTRKEAEASIRMLADAGFGNLNLDLMFGLPGQTMDMWLASLAFAFSMPVTHLSFYSLSIEEGTPWGDLYARGLLAPAADELDRRMYHAARARLREEGFTQYELSNAARPGLSCRHNLIYWNRGEYLGIGAGAHSLMDDMRFSNEMSPDIHMARIGRGELPQRSAERLGARDILSERLFMGLRLLAGLDMEQVGLETGLQVEAAFPGELSRLLRAGLLEQDASVFRLTEKGMDLANEVFRAFV